MHLKVSEALNLNELKFDVKVCEIKAEDFQATFLILLA